MTDRHVMTVEAGRCACGQPLPPPPTGGGRARAYCSRACQQRAYRTRTDPAPDPASVAGLLTAVRRVAAALDAGHPADPGDLATVRDDTAGLLARAGHPAAEPAPSGRHVTTAGTARGDAAAEPAAGSRHREDGPPAPVATPAPAPVAAAAPPRTPPARRPARMTVTGPDGLRRTVGPETAAAIRAVTAAPTGQVPALARSGRDPTGWTVTLDGVVLGTLAPRRTLRGGVGGWQPHFPGPGALAVPGGERPTRDAAALALAAALDRMHRRRGRPRG